MCHALNGILNGMSKVIHGINAPFVACIVMCHVGHTVDDRVSHIDVRGSHINLSPEHFASVLKLPVFHALKQVQVLLHTSVSVWAFLSRLCEGSAVFTDLLCSQITDKRFSFFDQLYRCLIHLFKIIGGKIQTVLPVCAQPFDIRLDGFHKLHLFFCGVGIVKTHVELSMVFLCQAIVEQD